jgi:hypothetical protein
MAVRKRRRRGPLELLGARVQGSHSSSTGNAAMSIQESVALALKDAELSEFSAWQDLDALSARTEIDQIDLLEEQVRVDGDRIEGPINVFVTLHYGDRADGFEETEEFPGRFTATWKETVSSSTTFTSMYVRFTSKCLFLPASGGSPSPRARRRSRCPAQARCARRRGSARP